MSCTFLGSYETALTKCFIFIHCTSLELDWFSAGWFLRRFLLGCIGIRTAFESASWSLSENFLDIWLSFVIIVITELVCKSTLTCFSLDILVNACSCSVSKERLIIQVVILVIAKALAQSCRLIEQSLIKHHILYSWLSLTKCDLLRNISICIPLILSLVESSLFSSTIAFVLLPKQSADLISFFLLSRLLLIHKLHITVFSRALSNRL